MNRVVVGQRSLLMSLVVRGALALWCGLVLGLAGGAGPAWADESAAFLPQPRMAKGLIVKLKGHEAERRSVVRLQASAMPSESAQSLRLRMAAAAQRHRVSYLVQRPTAFGAHLLHSGRAIPYEEARAEATRLSQDPDVEWVIVNEMERPAAVVNHTDPEYGSQTWLQPRQTFTGGRKGVANIEPAWDLIGSRSLSPVVVAVLDTGKLAAGDLAGRMAQGYDMVSEADYDADGIPGQDSDASDPGIDIAKITTPALRVGCANPARQWHGLSILAMLGAAADNGLNGTGVLAPIPGAVVLPVRVAGMCGAAVSDIIEGMLWSAGIDYQGSPSHNLVPARVINLSFGGTGSCNGDHDAGWLYRQTIQTLESKGVLVVASAGNGDEASGLGLAGATRPANCPGVLAVTALNDAGYKARYANLINSANQTSLAVAAGDVNSSDQLVDNAVVTLTNGGTGPLGPDNNFYMSAFAGTSAAAPIAAGVAALMLAVDPSLTVPDLRTLLTSKSAPFPTAGFGGMAFCVAGQDQQGNCICTASTCGAGMLDAREAVQAAIDHAATASGPASSVVSAANTCYFRPDRLGGGSTCPTSSSGGGGGAVDALSLLALACVTGLAWMGRQRAA
jgi:serine protease